MKLVFDAGRCDGWGMCTIVFPEGISLDRWGFAHVDPEPIVDEKLQRRARRAAACCPRRALTVSDDEPVPTAPTTDSGWCEPQ